MEHKISLAELMDSKTRPEAGKLKGVQGILYGSYWLEGERIRLDIQLLDLTTGKQFTTVGYVSQKAIPKNIQIQPENFQQAVVAWKELASGKKSEFEVKVWVDKSNASTYTVGEHLRIHFKAEKDCYVKLYHVDARGTVQLIFPNNEDKDNEIKAGVVYTIPQKGKPVVITEPLGTEFIKAIASTAPMKAENAFEPLGRLDQACLQKFQESITNKGIKLGEAAEASCLYTIISVPKE
jgi:hypothetical protein